MEQTENYLLKML